jgi:hypothetical protein
MRYSIRQLGQPSWADVATIREARIEVQRARRVLGVAMVIVDNEKGEVVK